MKIAVLGGTFNPFHIGHAMLAETVIKELGYDKILFVPACIPPHKEIQEGADSFQRLEMVKAFCQSENSFYYEVEDCEIQRGGLSYTCDTLIFLSKKYEGKLEGKIGLIMGEEIAAEFDKWKNPEKILELADLIIVPRKPDYSAFDNQNKKNEPRGTYLGDFKTKFDKNTFKYPFIPLKENIIELSSTEIRRKIREGKSYKYLVPSAVFDYIEKANLYGKKCN